MVIASKLIELLRKQISVILYGPPATTKLKPRLDLNEYSYLMDQLMNDKTYWSCIQ